MPDEQIPLARPDLGDRERELVLETLESGRLSLGPMVERFERGFAGWINRRFDSVRHGYTRELASTLRYRPVVLVLCFVGQLTFVLTFGDLLGFIDAFIINLVMSALFVAMYFARQPDGVGLNYPAAWLKMIGTACTSIQCAALLPVIRPDIPSWGFLYFLYLLIFALDVIYVVLLHNARRSALSNVTKAP